jgi:hypothetical protein
MPATNDLKKQFDLKGKGFFILPEEEPKQETVYIFTTRQLILLIIINDLVLLAGIYVGRLLF